MSRSIFRWMRNWIYADVPRGAYVDLESAGESKLSLDGLVARERDTGGLARFGNPHGGRGGAARRAA